MGKWYTEADLSAAELVWLLDLELGGVMYRFASETMTVDGANGVVYSYTGTLSDVDFAADVEFGSADFDLPAASVTVTFREDLAKRIAQGVDFAAATAELAIFRKGQDDDHADRQVVLSGRLDAPRYGAVGEAVAFNIESDWLRASAMIPAPNQAVDQSINWDDCDDNAQGAIYPTLFGAPGQQNFSGSPIYVVDGAGGGAVTGLVASHPCTAATIKVLRVRGDTGASSTLAGEALASSLDSKNQPYSYVTLSAGQYAEGDSYFAHFNEGGGGLINPFSTGRNSASGNTPAYLTGAGDVLRYLLHQSGAKVDDGKCAAASGVLNAFEIEGYLAERVNVMEFIKELLELLPCSLRATAEGLYPVVWRWDAKPADCMARLTADRDWFRDGPCEYVSGDIFNEITLRYRHNAHYNKLQKSVTVTGDLAKETSGFVWRNVYTVGSFSRYGSRALELETEMVSSRATAGRIVNWMSRAHCAQHRSIKYSAPMKLAYIQVGDAVAVTDSDLHLTDQVALIQAVEFTEAGLVFTLLLISDPPRDTIPT